MSIQRYLCWVVLLLAASVGNTYAQDAPWLPESPEPAAQRSTTSVAGHLFIDAGLDKSSDLAHANLGLDARVEQSYGSMWRAYAGGRFDWDDYSQDRPGTSHYALTLRELFIRRDAADFTLDAGRMMLRDGVGYGYNPSELFRAGALPLQRTRDPQQLRDSRLGVVALRSVVRRGDNEWALVLTPALHNPSDPESYDPRWGAVNDGRGQVLLKWTPPRWGGVYTNLIAQRLQGGARTAAMNLSASLGSAIVAYIEAARSERIRLVDLAVAPPPLQSVRWQTQSAVGLSVTTETRQTYTFEWQRNGAGLSREDWRGPWQQANAVGLAAAFNAAAHASDPLGRDSVMLALQWERFGWRHADLNALLRFNLVDSSRLGWVEWRYRQPSTEWALNLTWMNGAPRSEFGVADVPWSVGLRWRHYR